MPGPFKLVVLDVDGTLVDEEGRVPEPTAQALCAAREQGISVTLATGRIHHGVRGLVEELKLGAPLILANGGLITSPDGKILHQQTLLPEELAALLDFYRWREMAAAVATLQDELHVHIPFDGREALRADEELARFGFWRRHQVPGWASLPRRDAVKVMATAASPQELEETLRTWPRELSHLSHALSHPLWVEANPPGVNKATGAAWVARKLGCQPGQVLAAGDGETDRPLLEWAGTGVFLRPERVTVLGGPPIHPPDTGPQALSWVLRHYLELG